MLERQEKFSDIKFFLHLFNEGIISEQELSYAMSMWHSNRKLWTKLVLSNLALSIQSSDRFISMQNWWIDWNASPQESNRRRCDAQHDWELLWDKEFIFSGCGGKYYDMSRLEQIIIAAQDRLNEYKEIPE